MIRKLTNWLGTWWFKVPHPRVFSVVYGVVYSIAIATGIFTILFPPITLLGFLGTITAYLVGFFFAIFGFIGAIAGTSQSWKLERLAIYGILLGISAYLATVIHYALVLDTGYIFTLLGIFAFALMLFIVRLAMIWYYTFNPRG